MLCMIVFSEPVVGCEYVDEILLKIRGALPSNTREHTMSEEELHTCVSFVCDVAENFFSNVKVCKKQMLIHMFMIFLFI